MCGCQTPDKDAVKVEDADKIGEVAEDRQLHDQSQDRTDGLVG
jgi:hypothetical protein